MESLRTNGQSAQRLQILIEHRVRQFNMGLQPTKNPANAQTPNRQTNLIGNNGSRCTHEFLQVCDGFGWVWHTRTKMYEGEKILPIPFVVFLPFLLRISTSVNWVNPLKS